MHVPLEVGTCQFQQAMWQVIRQEGRLGQVGDGTDMPLHRWITQSALAQLAPKCRQYFAIAHNDATLRLDQASDLILGQ